MRSALWALAGAALAAVLVAGTGILAIQRVGAEAGAVLGLDNEVAGVTAPGPGLLHLIAIAALSGLALLLLTAGVAGRERSARRVFRGSFSVSAASLVLASWVLQSIEPERSAGLRPGFAPWWQGWLEQGGVNSAVHVVLLVALALLWPDRDLQRSLARKRAKQVPAPPHEDLF